MLATCCSPTGPGPMTVFILFYLTIANVMIGVFKGVALSGSWRLPLWRSVRIMTAANFLSAWLGAIYLTIAASYMVPGINEHVWSWGAFAGLFGLTILLQRPFVHAVLSPRRATSQQALRATLCIHAVSYPLMLAAGLWVNDFLPLTRWEWQ